MKKIINLIVIVLFTFIITGCSNYHVIGKYLYDPTGYSIGNKVFHSEVNSIFVNWKVGNIYVIQSENHELIIREEVDISLTKDVYKVKTTINGETMEYDFNQNNTLNGATEGLGGSQRSPNDYLQDFIIKKPYGLELYEFDYKFRVDQYLSEEVNDKAQNVNDLKINGTTLMKISKGKNIKYVVGSENIEEYLK